MTTKEFQVLGKKTVIIVVLSGMLSGVAYNGGTPIWEDSGDGLFGYESMNRSLIALTAQEQPRRLTAKASPPDVLLQSIPSKAEAPDAMHQVTPFKVKASPPYFKMTRGPQRRAARVRDAHRHDSHDAGTSDSFWELITTSPITYHSSSLFRPQQKREDRA